jgi:hypothetical protein
MDFKEKRFVKVRVNASGRRLIGIIVIPPPHFRISDFLNSHDEFLLVKQEKTDTVLEKNAVSYLEALEEGQDSGSRPAKGSFHRVVVTLKNHVGSLEGELFIPEGSNLLGTLNKLRRFVNLRNVSFVNTPEKYEFLAIGKQEIIMIQEAAPAR